MPTRADPTHDTLFYDGNCELCRGSVRLLRRIDWLGRLRYEDFTALPDGALPVDRETALGGIPMRTRDGRTLVGFPAARRALLQTPPGFLPALLMYVPGLSHLGGMVYHHVSTNRRRQHTCPICQGEPEASPADPRQTG